VSSPRLHHRFLGTLVAASLAVGFASGCASTQSPQLKVLAVEPQRRVQPRRAVVLYVEVVNPAARPMRLQRLQYTFAASGERTSTGEVPLTRIIEPGAAVVVEVPVTIESSDLTPGETLTLRGKLYAELDRMVRTFSVSAEVPAPEQGR
jgi:LEA14-like dessication related protein